MLRLLQILLKIFLSLLPGFVNVLGRDTGGYGETASRRRQGFFFKIEKGCDAFHHPGGYPAVSKIATAIVAND